MPAARAAAIVSAWTCDTNPSVGTDRSSGSAFMAATVSIGRSFTLSRSKMTSCGRLSRIGLERVLAGTLEVDLGVHQSGRPS